MEKDQKCRNGKAMADDGLDEIEVRHVVCGKRRKRKTKELKKLKKGPIVEHHDFFFLRLVIVSLITLCFMMFFMHVTRRDVKSYEMLHDILEEIKPLTYHNVKFMIHKRWSKLEKSEHWVWDSERETLKVNTSLFVH